jgi:hypothetical protein
MSVFLWCSLCLLFAKINDNADDGGPIALFYIGSFPIWVYIKFLCDKRVSNLIKLTPDSVASIYEVELTTRFILLKELGSLREMPN